MFYSGSIHCWVNQRFWHVINLPKNHLSTTSSLSPDRNALGPIFQYYKYIYCVKRCPEYIRLANRRDVYNTIGNKKSPLDIIHYTRGGEGEGECYREMKLQIYTASLFPGHLFVNLRRKRESGRERERARESERKHSKQRGVRLFGLSKFRAYKVLSRLC